MVVQNDPNGFRGPLLLIAGMFCFALMDSLTVFLFNEISLVQLLTIRYWLFLLFALIYSHYTVGIITAFKTSRLKFQITRSLIALAEVGVFLLGLKFLALNEAHALLAIFPLVTILLGVFFLREKIGRIALTGVLIGFLGALIILKPGAGVFSVAATLPLMAALLFAIYQIMTRFVTTFDSYPTTLLYTAVTGAIISTIFVIPNWSQTSILNWILIIVMGSLGVAAQWFVISALHNSAASQLQPFNYSLLLFATALGYLLFDQVPTITTVIGAFAIALGGLIAILGDRRPRLVVTP
jgi:drug/metabolite transporter (DMT)-like permease